MVTSVFSCRLCATILSEVDIRTPSVPVSAISSPVRRPDASSGHMTDIRLVGLFFFVSPGNKETSFAPAAMSLPTTLPRTSPDTSSTLVSNTQTRSVLRPPCPKAWPAEAAAAVAVAADARGSDPRTSFSTFEIPSTSACPAPYPTDSTRMQG